jgi:hypothetical protein
MASPSGFRRACLPLPVFLASLVAMASLATPAFGAAFPYSSWTDSLSLFRYTAPVRMTLLLPPDGPGAAPLNPARLADGERGYVQAGRRKTWDSQGSEFSLGGGIFRRFYLGAFFTGASGDFLPMSNAVILDNRFGFQAAYRHPLDAEGKGHLSLGISNTFRQVNLISAFKSTRYTPDFGLVLAPSSSPGGWGLEFGWALRDIRAFDATSVNLRSASEESPSPHVDFAPWLTTASVIANSPARHWGLFAEGAAGARYEPAYSDRALAGLDAGPARLYLPRIGVRYRPLDQVSLALERVWSRYWAANATVGTGAWLPVRLETDLRSAYGPYLRYLGPDRSGWSLAWNVRVVW